MTRLIVMPPPGAYRVAWWALAVLLAITLLLFIRAEVARWAREIPGCPPGREGGLPGGEGRD